MNKRIDRAIIILRELQFKPGLDGSQVNKIEKVIDLLKDLSDTKWFSINYQARTSRPLCPVHQSRTSNAGTLKTKTRCADIQDDIAPGTPNVSAPRERITDADTLKSIE
jgi:hypothetical protein